MKHLFTVLTTVITALLMSHSSKAQNFNWVSSGSNVITNTAPLVLTTTVERIGKINVAEGKSPLVVLSIDHTYTADLDITLTSPSGTSIILTSENGGTGDNYTQTVFANTATNSITTGTAPFSGFFLPQESFTAFDGEFAEGVWTLTVTDIAAGDDGAYIGGFLNFTDKCTFSYGLINGDIAQDGSYLNDINIPTSGVTWVKNIHNQANNALLFDGTNNATASKQATPTKGVTMAAWIKPSNVNTDQKVMGIADATNTIDLVSLGIYNGVADFEVKEESGSGRVSMGSLVDDQWVHIAGTWSIADSTIRLYVNGNLVGTTTGPISQLSFTYPNTTSHYPVFGAAAWSPVSFQYEGAMDDMRMYGQALSQWQIRDIVANFNQHCETAVDLPVTGHSCSGDYYAHNYGGNGISGTATTCTGNSGAHSWFTVTVPTSGELTISTDAVSGSGAFDVLIEAYSGTCDNLTYIDCVDGGGSFTDLPLTGLTPGDVLYVRTWHYFNQNYGPYVVCAYDPVNDAGVNELEDLISMDVYPNPATDNVTIQVSLETSSDLSLILSNTLGQTIFTRQIPNTQSLEYSFDVSNLSAGAYLVTLQGNKGKQTRRLIIE